MENKAHEFTKEEIDYIISNWGVVSPTRMAKMFSSSFETIVKVARQHNLTYQNTTKWQKEDEELLQSLAGELSVSEIAEALHRTPTAIKKKAKELDIPLLISRVWTKEEDKYLKNNWGNKSITEIATDLRRSVRAVRIRASELYLGKMINKTDNVMFLSDIASVSGVHPKTISYKWPKIGLNLRKYYLSEKSFYLGVPIPSLKLFIENYKMKRLKSEDREETYRDQSINRLYNYLYDLNCPSIFSPSSFHLTYKMFNLMPIALKSLAYFNVYTLEDLIKFSKSRLGEINGLGKAKIDSLVEVVHSLGYHFVDDENELGEIPLTRELPLILFGFSGRTYNALRRSNVTTVGDLLDVDLEALEKSIRCGKIGFASIKDLATNLRIIFRDQEIDRLTKKVELYYLKRDLLKLKDTVLKGRIEELNNEIFNLENQRNKKPLA